MSREPDTSRDNDQWVKELAVRDDAALSDLRDVLLRNLRSGLAGRRIDDAFLEDVTQDSLLRILDRLDQFQGRSRFVTWATSVAIRVAFGELRGRKWKDVSLNEVMSDAGFVPQRAIDPSLTPDQQLQRQSILESMHRVIESELTTKQRTALLAEIKGMPQDEIARQMGSNRNAIYKLTHDARKKLKHGLQEAGYTSEDLDATYVM